MNKFLSLAVAIGISGLRVAATQAMPLAPLEQAQAGLTIPVAGGCGPGFHRGPYGGCRSRMVITVASYYGAPAVVAAPGASGCSGSRGGARPLRWSGLASVFATRTGAGGFATDLHVKFRDNVRWPRFCGAIFQIEAELTESNGPARLGGPTEIQQPGIFPVHAWPPSSHSPTIRRPGSPPVRLPG